MREALLLVIVFVISLVALVRPRVGIYGYAWYSLMRPDVLAWLTVSNYYSTVLAIATLLGSLPLLLPRLPALFRSKIAIGILIFIITCGIATATAINTEAALTPYWNFVRVMLVLLMMPIVFETREQLRTLFFVCAASLGVLGLKFGVYGILHGGARFNTGTVADNNFVAVSFTIAIALCWYSIPMIEHKLLRLAAYFTVLLTIAATIMTYSRGGALALGFTLLLIAMRSRHKVIILLLLVIFTLPGLYLAGEAYTDRMATIADPMSEGSAASRIYLAQVGIQMWRDHPLVGVGFGRTNQQQLLPSYVPEAFIESGYSAKVLHNTYIQLMVDCGLVGFLPFFVILVGSILYLRRAAKRAPSPLNAIPLGIETALIAFAIGGTFISAMPTFDTFFFLITMAATWEALEKAPQYETMGIAPVAERVGHPLRRSVEAH